MLRIDAVAEGSEGARLGLLSGDRILSINGRPVRDLLDFHFEMADVEEAALEIQRGAVASTLPVPLNGSRDLGLSFADMKTRLCGNDCVFCFIDQLPQGMRPTLYVKDEDYRLSFLHGNFVTLTNLKEWEIRRIAEQHLSPLYISVHSTNPETRRRLLRARVDRNIMPILDYFRDSNIVMHTQVVLCPGYNDGADLMQTVRDLACYYPAVQSLAVVPLGMTDHRDGLAALDPVTPELADRTLDEMAVFQGEFLRQWGIRFVYMADEWYRLLARPVPSAAHYDGFPQIENGIGMTRHFLNRLGRMRRIFPDAEMRGVRRVTLVTGALFRSTLEEAVRTKLARTGEKVEIDVVGLENDFFGRRVTVAGLLVGRDLASALESRALGDEVILPPATLNEDDIFLDNMSLAELAGRLGCPVRAGFRDRLW